MGSKKRIRTQTSRFGTSGRISHDASRFYASRLYQGVNSVSTPSSSQKILPEYLDHILAKSSESMTELPPESVHLMITSPPYNVSKEYDNDFTLDEYREFLRTVLREVHRVLVVGGRACINIANVGRKPYFPLHSYVIQDMLDLGFLMRGANGGTIPEHWDGHQCHFQDR